VRSFDRFPIVSVVVSGFIGCAADQRSSAQDVVADTAVSETEGGVAWSISDAPALHVGRGDGVAFGWISAATVLTDGTVVAADNLEKVLHIFGSDGTHIRKVGGRGEGPGEFEATSQLIRSGGDTLIVSDQLSHRVSFFDSSGEYIRLVRPKTEHSSDLAVLGAIAGDLLIQALYARGRKEGLSRDTMIIALMDRRTGAVTPLSRVPGGEYVATITADRLRMRRAPFARSTLAAATSDRYAIGYADNDSIVVFDSNHALLHQIPRGERSIARVRKADVRRYYDATRPPGSDVDAYLRRAGNPDVAPASMPAFDKLIFDRSGNLWVRRYRPPWHPGAEIWDVYDMNGRAIGDVPVLMKGGEIVEIGDNYIVAVLTDSMDTETLAVYGLVRRSIQ
jgi:hypothetical protein